MDWLEATDEDLRERYDRLFVPKNDPRYLRRNAHVALGNAGGPEHLPLAAAYAATDDPLLREHAGWAVRRMRARQDG